MSFWDTPRRIVFDNIQKHWNLSRNGHIVIQYYYQWYTLYTHFGELFIKWFLWECESFQTHRDRRVCQSLIRRYSGANGATERVNNSYYAPFVYLRPGSLLLDRYFKIRESWHALREHERNASNKSLLCRDPLIRVWTEESHFWLIRHTLIIPKRKRERGGGEGEIHKKKIRQNEKEKEIVNVGLSFSLFKIIILHIKLRLVSRLLLNRGSLIVLYAFRARRPLLHLIEKTVVCIGGDLLNTTWTRPRRYLYESW